MLVNHDSIRRRAQTLLVFCAFAGVSSFAAAQTSPAVTGQCAVQEVDKDKNVDAVNFDRLARCVKDMQTELDRMKKTDHAEMDRD